MIGKIYRKAWLCGYHFKIRFLSTYYNCVNQAYCALHPAIFADPSARLNGPIIWMVHAESSVTIGPGVRINSGKGINPLGSFRKTIIYVGKGGHLTIESGAGLSSCSICAQLEIRIGEKVMIGANSTIMDTDFHTLQMTPESKEATFKKPVVLMEKCFVGANCTILKGTEMGCHSILAAGSVTSKKIPSYEIWGGAPAKPILRKPSDV